MSGHTESNTCYIADNIKKKLLVAEAETNFGSRIQK